ncbi:hypothetical protein G7046_g3804 [Stylonectria norvegica]|nr:hypothetical protein G7046_g3804 [Stylonectria norvegica]
MLAQKILTSAVSACSPGNIPYPAVFGAEIFSLSADLISNFTLTVPYQIGFHHPTISLQNASFCNVTVSYTHPGQDDYINVEVWLPVGGWNKRLQAVGGGGWQAGRFYLSDMLMAAAIGEGYATVSTDAGLGHASLPTDWALLSPGNVNLYALQNLASVSLKDEALIAKSVIKSFYNEPPKFSYWSGCSQGGRQGLMLAQRYPDVYDGIVASAPAINWSELFSSIYWPYHILNHLGQNPRACELAYLTRAAVLACDANDGVVDGVISDTESCDFNASTAVGDTFYCDETDSKIQISSAAAVVANAVWSGPRDTSGRFLWHGLGYGSDLEGISQTHNAADTGCRDTTYKAFPTPFVTEWIRLFLEKDPSFDANNITGQDFDRFFHSAVSQYTSMLGTNDPDLSAFRDAGGKLLTFHGLADQIIPYKGTEQYYESVASRTSGIDSFYRHFQVPGLGHCTGGNGASPKTAFDQLRAWVENGTKPETVPVTFNGTGNLQFDRPLCPFPKIARFTGGDPTSAENFSCVA